jgi:starch-binding outer membrane protein, SusD/RagB family
MRLKYLFGGFLGLMLTLTSCKKQLELKDPQGLDPADAVANDANIKKLMQGAYDAMSSGNMYGGNAQMFADFLAANGELYFVGTFNTYREIWGKQILTTNPNVSGLWGAGYNAINVANTVIANIGKVAPADSAKIRAEALFVRAAMHFELVRFFAKDYTDGNPATNPGVPLMLTSTNNTGEITQPSRASVAAVYAQIIADLTTAEPLLPTTNTVFATRSAAAAILSRVYMQKADYPAAAAAANRAISNAVGKSLIPYMSNFNQAANTAEDIFAIQVSDQDGANNLQVFYSVDIFGGRDGDVEIDGSHLALYDAGDARATITSNPGSTTQFNTAFYTKYGAYRTTKWRDLYKNVKVIRLAELYLTRAEANFRAGTTVGATPLADVNRIRSRASLVDLPAILSVNDIYLERRRELAFEGFGIHDARRFKRTIDGRAWNDNSLVFPIPFRERNANPNLSQNPGYN